MRQNLAFLQSCILAKVVSKLGRNALMIIILNNIIIISILGAPTEVRNARMQECKIARLQENGVFPDLGWGKNLPYMP